MKFRKKPVVIEAWRNEERGGVMPEWLAQACASGMVCPARSGSLLIQTLEGHMVASLGDWVIRGIKGELYPCRDDIFRATYEEVVG